MRGVRREGGKEVVACNRWMNDIADGFVNVWPGEGWEARGWVVGGVVGLIRSFVHFHFLRTEGSGLNLECENK